MATITIIGTGLIGCSFGLALRKQGHFVIGCDKNNKNLELAKQLNAIDAANQSFNLPMSRYPDIPIIIGNRESGIGTISQSSVVLLATPVDHILEILPLVLDNLPKDAVVIDTGSTKMTICERVQNHPRRSAFIAAHPMAGSEQSGPQAANPRLFENKKIAICESHLSSETSLSKAIQLFESIGMNPVFMSPEQHDSTVALVSHLPQILSYAFASLPDFQDNECTQWTKIASSGFESFTRLAKSTPEVWLPIIFENREYIIEALESLEKNISVITDSLRSSNAMPLIDQIERANKNRVLFEDQQKKIGQQIELIPLTE